MGWWMGTRGIRTRRGGIRMNELKTRRIINQYKDYYMMYNKLTRPVVEKQETPVVEGIVTWDESSVHSPIKLAISK